MISTLNKFFIAVDAGADRIGPLLPISWPMPADDALVLAAWLVAITGRVDEFNQLLGRVLDT